MPPGNAKRGARQWLFLGTDPRSFISTRRFLYANRYSHRRRRRRRRRKLPRRHRPNAKSASKFCRRDVRARLRFVRAIFSSTLETEIVTRRTTRFESFLRNCEARQKLFHQIGDTKKKEKGEKDERKRERGRHRCVSESDKSRALYRPGSFGTICIYTHIFRVPSGNLRGRPRMNRD